MRFVEVPVAELRGLVLIEAEIDAHRNFRTLESVCEVEIGGRVVYRIAAENDEQVNFSGAHVGNELFDRVDLVDRTCADRVGVENRLTDVAERGVHGVGEGMNFGQLVVANNNYSSATVIHQVSVSRHGKITRVMYGAVLPLSSLTHQLRNFENLRRTHGQAMIRLHPRRTRRALNHVQPAHLSIGIAPAGEIADVARVAGEAGIQKVGVERDNHVGLREVVARLDGLAEGELRAFQRVVAIDWLVDMPLRLRIHREERLHLIFECRRRNGRSKNANASTAQRLLNGERPSDRIAE